MAGPASAAPYPGLTLQALFWPALRQLMASNGFGSWHHLAGRFFGALSPAGPPADDEAWALSSLLEGEQALWARMSGPDRRHAVGVARDTVQLLQTRPTAPGGRRRRAAPRRRQGRVRPGDLRPGGGHPGGHDRRPQPPARRGPDSRSPRPRPSWRARIGMYLAHDRLGAELLQSAGSDELTITWAREHHLPSCPVDCR